MLQPALNKNQPESSASAGEALPGARASIVHAQHSGATGLPEESSVFSAAQFALSRRKKKGSV